MVRNEPTYAIIGGGIVGASIAYHLSSRSSASVLVFEKHAIGAETTAKSMAMYGLYGDEVQYRMKRYGLRLYNEFLANPRTELAYQFAGRLRVATSEVGAAELRSDVTAVQADSPPRDLVEYVEGDALHETLVFPHLATDEIVGAAFRPRVGYMRPAALAREFASRARTHGACFRVGTSVEDVRVENEQVVGIHSSDGVVPVDAVICAAGPWNVHIARQVGLDLPVRHTLAPVIKLATGNRADYSLPTISHHESPYAIHHQRARDPGAVYISAHPTAPTPTLPSFFEAYEIFDPDRVTERIPTTFRDGMLETTARFMPDQEVELVDEWVGVRSMTPDGNPIVGWTGLPGFFIAAFNTSGIQLAPKVGDVIARQVLAGESTALYDGLSITRFSGYSDIHNGKPSA